MFDETAVKTFEDSSIVDCTDGEVLKQLAELQLVLTGGGIGTVTIA